MLLTSLDPAGCGTVDSVAAVTVGAKSMSRAQLFDAACALAGSLPDGGPVAVCAEPTLDTVIAVTAFVLTGVAVVPIPHDSAAPSCGTSSPTPRSPAGRGRRTSTRISR